MLANSLYSFQSVCNARRKNEWKKKAARRSSSHFSIYYEEMTRCVFIMERMVVILYSSIFLAKRRAKLETRFFDFSDRWPGDVLIDGEVPTEIILVWLRVPLRIRTNDTLPSPSNLNTADPVLSRTISVSSCTSHYFSNALY